MSLSTVDRLLAVWILLAMVSLALIRPTGAHSVLLSAGKVLCALCGDCGGRGPGLMPLQLMQVLGVILGYYVPSVQQALSAVSIDMVSLPVAVGLWGMMWPVLAKVGEAHPAKMRLPAAPPMLPDCHRGKRLLSSPKKKTLSENLCPLDVCPGSTTEG